MSPAFYPLPGNFAAEELFERFLQAANVSTLQEARQLPSSSLIRANNDIILQSPYGSFTYGKKIPIVRPCQNSNCFGGPVVDGDFMPGMPGKLLKQGSFDHNLNIMAGHCVNEVSQFQQFSVYAAKADLLRV